MQIPIPKESSCTDPLWQSQFIDLANDLVRVRTKAKIIEYFTGLPHRFVCKLYKALLGEIPPSGPVHQGTPKFFAQNRDYGANWNLQCAIFLNAYSRLGKLVGSDVNRGWLLLKSYHAYLQCTEILYLKKNIRRLDINNCYSLLVWSGYVRHRDHADLHMVECKMCGSPYMVVADEEPEGQPCPVCSMDAASKKQQKANGIFTLNSNPLEANSKG